MPYDMYSKPPQIVFGFHGCDESVFDEAVRRGGSLDPSTNDYDWLGSGACFWENSYDRALEWARNSRSIKTPAVIGAVIDLGRCLNLTDSEYTDILVEEFEIMQGEYEDLGIPMPTNAGRGEDKPLRRLDCAVIEHLHSFYDGIPGAGFDTVRGLFSEGDPIFPGSGIRGRTHVQICVRNPNCIKGFFEPRSRDDAFDLP